MAKAEKKPKGTFQVIEFGGKIVSVYRKCSCGGGGGDDMVGNVEIKVDEKTGKKTATCHSCGNTLTWGGKE
jgi:hypothetical protein